MCGEELTGHVCAIDLESLVRAREFLDQTEVVKCGCNIEEVWVEAKLSLTTRLSCEEVDPHRVIKEQICGMLAQEISGLFRKQRIGNSKR
jgi:hypothetical protein